MNIFTCLRIIYLKRKKETQENMEKITEMLQLLILNEWIEVAVPIGNVLCLLLGFYGPNKEQIGDIGCSYWQFKAIEDIQQPIKLLSWFFISDLISLFLTAYLLWKFCMINLYKGYIILKKEFVWPFAISLSIHLTGVSNLVTIMNHGLDKTCLNDICTLTSIIFQRFYTNMVGSASDLTRQFDWKDGYFNFTDPILETII